MGTDLIHMITTQCILLDSEAVSNDVGCAALMLSKILQSAIYEECHEMFYLE